MAVTQLCTIRDVQKQISIEGLNLRVDDDPAVASDVIDWASLTIYEHCLPRYTVANLQASEWVKRQCAILACYEVSERRNNKAPRSLMNKVIRLIGTPERPGGILEGIRAGSRNIADIPMRKVDVPVSSQPRIRLDPFPRTVIEKGRGTGTPEGYTQHTDKLEPPGFDYTIALWPVVLALASVAANLNGAF